MSILVDRLIVYIWHLFYQRKWHFEVHCHVAISTCLFLQVQSFVLFLISRLRHRKFMLTEMTLVVYLWSCCLIICFMVQHFFYQQKWRFKVYYSFLSFDVYPTKLHFTVHCSVVQRFNVCFVNKNDVSKWIAMLSYQCRCLFSWLLTFLWMMNEWFDVWDTINIISCWQK